jgi:hypothetical protein
MHNISILNKRNTIKLFESKLKHDYNKEEERFNKCRPSFIEISYDERRHNIIRQILIDEHAIVNP